MNLQADDFQVVLLSNRPELCMRIIGGLVNDESIDYVYCGSCDQKGNGIQIRLFESITKPLQSYRLHYDYTIFGNGIKAFNKLDETVYEGSYLDKQAIEDMVSVFRSRGYRSVEEMQNPTFKNRIDEKGDNCFKKGDLVYKFLSPKIWTAQPKQDTYGMQVGSLDQATDEETMNQIETICPTVKSYRLNHKPCFYQKEVNKLVALKNLVKQSKLEEKKTKFFLGDETEAMIASEYPDLCFTTLPNLNGTPVKSLNKALNKV